ncbi:glutamate 5-kinase [Novosphingopyxis sp.]|uniref:glutamate 5-kinase n=1 Tax=Novosphingopyxis sp. TaxID=2709690 RepID=UPI003B5A1DDF
MAAETDRRGAAALIGAAHTVVVKVGSSLLIDRDRGRPRTAWLHALAEDLAKLREDGKRVVIVTSGAMAFGWPRLGMARSDIVTERQAAAAAGQTLLMGAWENALGPHDIVAAQLLLSIGDIEAERRGANAHGTLETLLARGAVPVINENDSVATEELRFGDNDRLSASVAQLAGADLLILLSDVEGLFSADPSADPDAEHLPFLAAITPEIEAMAGVSTSGMGTGGMATKIAAARFAAGHSCATIIASGQAAHPIERLRGGARATVVAAAKA